MRRVFYGWHCLCPRIPSSVALLVLFGNYRKNVNITRQAVHCIDFCAHTHSHSASRDQQTTFSTITTTFEWTKRKQWHFRGRHSFLPSCRYEVTSLCSVVAIHSQFQHLHGISCNSFWFFDLTNRHAYGFRSFDCIAHIVLRTKSYSVQLMWFTLDSLHSNW